MLAAIKFSRVSKYFPIQLSRVQAADQTGETGGLTIKKLQPIMLSHELKKACSITYVCDVELSYADSPDRSAKPAIDKN
jgi:hypothetical protein